jgi:hypothetical protein
MLSISQNVAGQTQAKKDYTKQRKILYAPTGYDRVDILTNKGKEYKYYIFSKRTPLKLEVEGPTTLTIKIRLLYNMTMKGRQNFAVAIEEGGFLGTKSEIASYSFTTEKSRISTLRGEPNIIPSKAHSFKLKVPDGKYSYTISLPSMTPQTAAVRILIPKRDIKLTKRGR